MGHLRAFLCLSLTILAFNAVFIGKQFLRHDCLLGIGESCLRSRSHSKLTARESLVTGARSVAQPRKAPADEALPWGKATGNGGGATDTTDPAKLQERRRMRKNSEGEEGLKGTMAELLEGVEGGGGSGATRKHPEDAVVIGSRGGTAAEATLDREKARGRTLLRVGFADFWPGFNDASNVFTRMLETEFEVVPCTTDIDVLIFSVFGFTHQSISSRRRIFYTGENIRPDLDAADLSISFDRIDDPRHLRAPLWLIDMDWFDADTAPEHTNPELLSQRNRRFLPDQLDGITLINSQPSGFRVVLWPLLRSMLGDEKALSLGGLWTTPGEAPAARDGKFKAIARRKLHLAVENSVHPGYCTEKIMHAYAGNAVPVYHGDPTIERDFNPKSFLNLNGMTAEQAAEAVRELLGDPRRMEEMIAEPPMKEPFDATVYFRRICKVGWDAKSAQEGSSRSQRRE